MAIGAAAGGVGHLAVQIAVARGAEVIAIASAANHDFVRSLGADHVIDYHDGDVAEELHELHAGGIDAAFDLYGGESLEALRNAVRPGGRIASIAQPDPAGDRADLTGRYVFVRPSARRAVRARAGSSRTAGCAWRWPRSSRWPTPPRPWTASRTGTSAASSS